MPLQRYSLNRSVDSRSPRLAKAPFHTYLKYEYIMASANGLSDYIKRCWTPMYVKHICRKCQLCKRLNERVTAKLLNVAKPKYRFGHFQTFCDNHTILLLQIKYCA